MSNNLTIYLLTLTSLPFDVDQSVCLGPLDTIHTCISKSSVSPKGSYTKHGSKLDPDILS